MFKLMFPLMLRNYKDRDRIYSYIQDNFGITLTDERKTDLLETFGNVVYTTYSQICEDVALYLKRNGFLGEKIEELTGKHMGFTERFGFDRF
jgi:hypothetical protein